MTSIKIKTECSLYTSKNLAECRFEKMLKSLEPQLRRVEGVRLYRETLDAEAI